MQRHRSLHPLSQHHHFALVRALEIRRAAAARNREAALRRTARTFLQFWRQSGREHFRQEEEILLPAYARHANLATEAAVVRMLSEHALIRARVEQLREALAEKQPLEELLISLGKLLHDHVRLEEEQVFPQIEKALSEGELQALGLRLKRLHPKACARPGGR